jgi:hypothetical protein
LKVSPVFVLSVAASLRDLFAVPNVIKPSLPCPLSVHNVFPLGSDQSIHNQGAKKKPQEQEQTEKNGEGKDICLVRVFTG